MQLKQMYPPFINMSEGAQTAFIEKYRVKRLNDMERTVAKPVKRVTRPKASYSEAEKAAFRLLGIKPKEFEDMVK